MNCNGAKELINLELDGLLSAAEREALSRHLQLCPGCFKYREQLEGAVRQLMNLKRGTAPMGFHREVMARIARLSPHRQPSLAYLPGGLVACLVGLLGLLLLFIPLAGYWPAPGEYMPAPAEVEIDTELPQVSPTIDTVANQAVALLDTLLQGTTMIRLEFIIGTCLILASAWAMLLYLLAEAERPLAATMAIKVRKARPHA